MLPDFSPAAWALIAVASLLAFTVRGLSGFGSSMIGIGLMSLLLPPAQVVPAMLTLEVLSTAHLLPGLWRQVDWASLRWVLLASATATPAGIALLAVVPAAPMRLAVALVLLGIALFMLRRGAQPPAGSGPGRATALTAGALSGLLNGAVGISGPPVIVLYFSRTALAVGRASLIAYFLASDAVALGFAGTGGLLNRDVLHLVLASLPFALAGVWLGHRLYLGMDEGRLRRTVWGLLAGIGAVGLLRALATAWG